MTPIIFYLISSDSDDFLYSFIMSKMLKENIRTIIYCNEQSEADRIDDKFWKLGHTSFLPHGSYRDARPEDQPVYITNKEENPNGATSLVFYGVPSNTFISSFEKTITIYNMQDLNLMKLAQERYRQLKGFVDVELICHMKQGQSASWQDGQYLIE